MNVTRGIQSGCYDLYTSEHCLSEGFSFYHESVKGGAESIDSTRLLKSMLEICCNPEGRKSRLKNYNAIYDWLVLKGKDVRPVFMIVTSVDDKPGFERDN